MPKRHARNILQPFTLLLDTNENKQSPLIHSSLDLALLPVGIDSATNESATLLALHTAGHANVGVEDEAPDGVDPALVTRQDVVEFGRHIANGV